MTYLVFGQTGQVARELARLPDLVQSGLVQLGRDRADFSDPEACVAALRATHAETPLTAVINAAAWTAVDRAEAEEEAATLVNATTPGALARAAAELGLPFVHISTDYVFEGSGTRPWAPGDATGPLGAYGRTKLAGERAVAAAGGTHAILRTSWVFSAHGANFVKTMLRLSETRDKLTVVADQIGGPTPAAAIAAAVQAIAGALVADPSKSGTYHFSGAPDVSWADFAREILARAGRTTSVEDIPTSAYPTPAVRPPNSRMDCSATEAAFGIPRPDWRAGLEAVLADLGVAVPG
ncbi:dTDP-4-dehydrorhamnose reductase [Frigidibacter sp. MR17.24]|uniref:dTDP-4-dehydrorhamnose reductase n=1 Tax=Frigidibacter sp. MR17.24 TaxID=3127345 RepID=UPI0030130B88